MELKRRKMELTDCYDCYADGTYGHRYIRSMLAEILISAWENNPRPYAISSKHITALAYSLREEMSDDESDENEALDILNTHFCAPGHWFEFIDGNLILVREGENNA